MKLILHQAIKDLRAERWLAAAWATMLLAACAAEALKLEATFAWPLRALALGRVVLGWVLAIRIVHADPLDGTNAFWFTRPLSPRMLLAAKSGLIGGLLLVVPAAPTLVVFVMNGVPFVSLPGLLAQWLLLEALSLLPLVLVATLTRDLARVVITLLVGIGGWGVLQLFCWGSAMRSVEPGYSDWQSSIMRAWLVIGIGVVALCAMLIVRQYLTRRTARVAFAALVAALGMITVAALWPMQLMVTYRPTWEDLENATPSGDWRGVDAISVAVPAESLRLLAASNDREWLLGDLRVGGLEEGVILRTAGGRGTLRFQAGGDAVEWRRAYALGYGVGPVSLADEASLSHFERMLGARFMDRIPVSMTGVRLVEIKTAVSAARRGGHADYDANLVFDAFRVKAAAVMPLRIGASGRAGGVETTVVGIQKAPKPGRYVIDLRGAAPRVLLTGNELRVECFLRNRKRGEAVVLWGDIRDAGSRGLSSTSVLVVRREGVIDKAVRSPGVSVDDAWLEDAELVLVSFERLARFTRHVTLADFVLPESVITPQGVKAGEKK
jgi:hypothetical protein